MIILFKSHIISQDETIWVKNEFFLMTFSCVQWYTFMWFLFFLHLTGEQLSNRLSRKNDSQELIFFPRFQSKIRLLALNPIKTELTRSGLLQTKKF